MVIRNTIYMIALLAVSGCGIDALLFTEFTRGSQVEVPGAGNNFIEGRSTAHTGTAVTFYTSTGVELPALATTTDGDGVFEVTLDAATQYDNVVVSLEGRALGLVPTVPKKTSVLDADRTVAMADLGVDSTAAALVVIAQARYGEPAVPLGAISPEDTTSIIAELEGLRVVGDDAVTPLYAAVEAGGGVLAFPAADETYLPGGDEPLIDAIAALSGANTCFSQDRIRVVLMVDFNSGNIDRNCAEIDHLKWIDDEPGRQMFVAGALHTTTPNCNTSEPPCLTTEQFDAFSVDVLGNLTPNVTAMYDDGTNGDLVAGDNVWTRTFEAPWFDAGSESGVWVRMHYKYTFGAPGQLWTTTEEWPGNSRLLEFRDVNGDRIITRYDNFADETTNKDKANLLAPAKGGCGKVDWASNDPPAQCVSDTLENMIDTDGDCVLDTWPAPGTAAPVTEPCGG